MACILQVAWHLKCCLNPAHEAKHLEHVSHLNNYWISLFVVVTHLYGLSPVCIRLWLTRFLSERKVFPHSEQENGLSPVCLRMCTGDHVYVDAFVNRRQQCHTCVQYFNDSRKFANSPRRSNSFTKLWPQSGHRWHF